MMNTKIELPISVNNIECITECWTFNRMILLKHLPYYEDWIASHYQLYVSRGRFHFEQLINTPEIYDTILLRRQLRYFEMTEDSIVNRFKQEINNGYYLNVMTKPHVEQNWYHEILLYGYDDSENMFYAIGFEGHGFKKVEYSYQFMVDMLKDMKTFFKKEKPQSGMRLSELFQYPISAFRLREGYSTAGCTFGAFHKIRAELNGEYYGEGTRNVNTWTYTGICCLIAWEDLLNELIKGNSELSSLLTVESVVKLLHEHRKLMITSMRYIQKKWKDAVEKSFADNIEGYQECCDIVEKWKNMTLKYKRTDNKEILKNIIEEIPALYEKEQMHLNNMVNHCIDWEKFNEYYI